MAMDYRRFGDWSKFNFEVDHANRPDGEPLYLNGYTGYQQYYVDMEGFWKDLYNTDIDEEMKELKEQIENAKNDAEKEKLESKLKNLEDNWYWKSETEEDKAKRFWNKQIFDEPEMLNF